MSTRAGSLPVDDAAAAILETVPLAMRAIRSRMREGRPEGLSVPQFRALVYLRRHPGTGPSEIAEHLGTSVPAASELVARLVRLDLLARTTDPLERRRTRLTLSASGADQLARAEDRALEWLRGLSAGLDPARAAALVLALADLRSLVLTAAGQSAPAAGSGPDGDDS